MSQAPSKALRTQQEHTRLIPSTREAFNVIEKN